MSDRQGTDARQDATSTSIEARRRVFPAPRVWSSPLYRALYDGDNDRVHALMAGRVGRRLKSSQLNHALTIATAFGLLEAVKILLDAGANPNFKVRNITPLALAAAYGDVPIVLDLLAHGADKDAPGRNGWPPLTHAVVRGHVEVARTLLDQGAAIDARDPLGRTPLHGAAQYGQEEAIDLLVTRGAAVDARTKAGLSPLMLAATNGREATVRVLLARGADPLVFAPPDQTALSLAANAGHANVADMLLDAGAQRSQASEAAQSAAALLTAVTAKQESLVQSLLDNSADPNATFQEWRPLAVAAYAGWPGLVRLLLAAGANPNAPNADGSTALMWASARQFRRCYDLLMTAGADASIEVTAADGPRAAIAVPQMRRSFRPVPRDAWYVRLLLRVTLINSARRRIEGIEVVVKGLSKAQAAAAFDRLEKAFRLLHSQAPRQFGRIGKAFSRIVVIPYFAAASYLPTFKWCIVSWPAGEDPGPTEQTVAALLVHEETHSRLLGLGFGYAEAERLRIERACERAAVAFAKRLRRGSGTVPIQHLPSLGFRREGPTDASICAQTVEFLRASGTSRWEARVWGWWLRRRDRRWRLTAEHPSRPPATPDGHE